MKHPAKIDDYGGNRYGSRYRTPMGSPGISSWSCRTCGCLRFVTRRELFRAAKQRCLKCGGTLIETKAEAKRHRVERALVEKIIAYRCRACGRNMGSFSPENLSEHLLARRDCLHWFRENAERLPCGAIFGTLAARRSKAKWCVFGLTPDGRETVVSTHRTLYMAHEWMEGQDHDRMPSQAESRKKRSPLEAVTANSIL